MLMSLKQREIKFKPRVKLNKNMHCRYHYRQIFGYIFWLINIFLSSSDLSILKEHSNINQEGKFEPDFRRKPLLKTRNFTKNVWLIATQPGILQFFMADISLNIARKELKIAQIAEVNQLFQLWK